MNRAPTSRRCRRAGAIVLLGAILAWVTTLFFNYSGHWAGLSLRIGTGTLAIYWGDRGDDPRNRQIPLWLDTVWPRPAQQRGASYHGRIPDRWSQPVASLVPFPLRPERPRGQLYGPQTTLLWRWGLAPPVLDLQSAPGAFKTFGLPFWPLVVVGLMLHALGRALRRQLPPGSCPRCAYDLRGAPTDTCPECGTRVDAAG